MSCAWPSISLRVAVVSRRVARPGLDGAELQQYLVGQGEERVADQDRLGGAVHLPHRVAVAALLVAVHQVVVQQREVVHQLHGDRAGHADLGRGAGRLRGEQRERGAHGLAAVAVGGVALGVDPAEVVGGDGVHGRGEPVHGRAQHRRGQRAAALQQRGHATRSSTAGVAGGTVHGLSSCCCPVVRCLPPPLGVTPPPRRRGAVAAGGRGRRARLGRRAARCARRSPWSRASRWRSTRRPGRGRARWCGRRAAAADAGGGGEGRGALPGDEEVPYLGAARGGQQPLQLRQVAGAQLGDRAVDLVLRGGLGQRQVLAARRAVPEASVRSKTHWTGAAERGEERAAQHRAVVDDVDVEDRRGADAQQPVRVVERARRAAGRGPRAAVRRGRRCRRVERLAAAGPVRRSSAPSAVAR